ncbi:UNVERIFIED_CONTAM: hypothetical protein H355_011126 [Colinus virginianus]|nr:hypothetical protein H355_011126 [Colinus virginianus]
MGNSTYVNLSLQSLIRLVVLSQRLVFTLSGQNNTFAVGYRITPDNSWESPRGEVLKATRKRVKNTMLARTDVPIQRVKRVTCGVGHPLRTAKLFLIDFGSLSVHEQRCNVTVASDIGDLQLVLFTSLYALHPCRRAFERIPFELFLLRCWRWRICRSCYRAVFVSPSPYTLQHAAGACSIQIFLSTVVVTQNFPCWTAVCPAVKADPSIVFARCIVVGGSLETTLRLKQVDPPSRDVFDVPPAEVYNANDLVEAAKIDEIGYLPHTNVACVLSLLKERYDQGLIYTTADPLLVAINPFKDLGNTTEAWIRKYRESGKPESLPPHVFKTARAALENLHGYQKNQTIIVSGESGAGKTEATKQAMRYFAAASSGGDNRVQQSILAGNPVLEAFGNAKTIRNNNSSRFGRFVMLELSVTEGIVHGMVSNFLLEKVRVVSQEVNERSYHIFYQLLKGADADMRSKLHLRGVQDYAYLTRRGGGCFDVPSVNDKADFAEVVDALEAIGLDSSMRESVFSIISGLLLIGNAKIDAKEVQGVPDAAMILASDRALLQEACTLMYIDPSALEEQLLTKSTKVGTQYIKGVRIQEDASVTLLSLSKNVYDKLFDWIVKQLNKNIQWQGSTPPFIGILDIFGFEVLEVNSLEQVLINVTNEYLQKHFIDVVFESEVKLYEAEGVSTAELTWTDNQTLVNSLCGKKDSFFALLEDTCLGLKATDEGFCGTVVRRLKGTGFFFEAPKDKRMKFVVRHTIADIEYTCEGMMEKNKDFLRKEVMDILNASSNPVANQLFEGVIIEAGKIGKGALIASRFLKDLESMLDVIRVGVYALR